MSKLTDAINALNQQKPSPFQEWVDKLDPEDRQALLTAAADPTIRHKHLRQIVADAGGHIGRDLFTEWRKANGFPS